MNTPELVIRPYETADEEKVVELWSRCHLIVPKNDPEKDIMLKLQTQPKLFLIGILGNEIVATAMAGYEGHRGWINYLAVSPDFRRRGIGRRMMAEADARLSARGCPKINVQIRASNKSVVAFYESLGFSMDEVVSMGKRLQLDDGLAP